MRLVMKFGGTSVGSVDRICHVANLVEREYNAGNEVAVVVSAMSGTTNQLVEHVDALAKVCDAPLYDAREYDTVVAAGEQITSGLLAMALQAKGILARSWLGWQIPIQTDNMHGRARIQDIDASVIKQRFEEKQVAVVAGFQGVSEEQRITTIGRGGSDTAAVALAIALKADRCDIYTDVDGVYTCDPRIVPSARKLEKISFEEMLEMASLGAKVLQTRSVELAMKGNIKLQVRSTFDDVPGTFVVNEDDIVEEEVVTGVAYSRDEAKITLLDVPDKPGISAAIFTPLADAGINVDMIVQNISEAGAVTDVTFTVSRTDLQRTSEILQNNKEKSGINRIHTDSKVAKVSVVGLGMRSHAGVAGKMFQTLADKGINIQVIATSEIKISVLIDEDTMELALRSLHAAYGLDK